MAVAERVGERRVHFKYDRHENFILFAGVIAFASIFNLLTTVHGDMAASDGPLAPAAAPAVPGI